ncbi:MAG: WhiB family transcriptional regulator [Actinomycetota bacterium]|nr:WhiB family transcriptional regulator [Actinomycetota bacterium]
MITNHLFRTTGAISAGGVAWKDVAACRGVNGRDFFAPAQGERRRERREREARAKDVCRGCAVRGECLEAAIANDERYGVWGGLTDAERARRYPRAS